MKNRKRKEVRENFLLKDLPDRLLEEATTLIKSYSTAFICNMEPAGSGTFVRIRGRAGILTAAHVWTELKRRSDRVTIMVQDGAHRFELELDKLVPHLNFEPKSKLRGPDIQFLEIPEIHARTIERKSKIFYNLSSKATERKRSALKNEGFAVVAGFPGELVDGKGKYKGEPLLVLRGGYISAVERIWVDGKFDYFETRADRNARDTPKSYKGVSGAGVWRVQLKKKRHAPILEATLGTHTLMGVAYYQKVESKNWLVLRHHGPRSIYSVLNKSIGARAQSQTS